PDYASSLHNLAVLYRDLGDFPRALPLLQQALELRKKTLGESNPHYASSLNNLAALYQEMGNYARPLPLYQPPLDIATAAWQGDLAILSERQRLCRIAALRLSLNNYLEGALAAQAPVAQTYRNLLTWKGAISSRQADETLVRAHPELQPTLERLRSARARLAHLAFATPSPQQQDTWRRQLDELREEKEQLEAELAQKCVPFREALQRTDPTPEQVIQAVPPDAVFVDFLVYAVGLHPKESKEKSLLEPHLL